MEAPKDSVQTPILFSAHREAMEKLIASDGKHVYRSKPGAYVSLLDKALFRIAETVIKEVRQAAKTPNTFEVTVNIVNTGTDTARERFLAEIFHNQFGFNIYQGPKFFPLLFWDESQNLNNSKALIDNRLYSKLLIVWPPEHRFVYSNDDIETHVIKTTPADVKFNVGGRDFAVHGYLIKENSNKWQDFLANPNEVTRGLTSVGVQGVLDYIYNQPVRKPAGVNDADFLNQVLVAAVRLGLKANDLDFQARINMDDFEDLKDTPQGDSQVTEQATGDSKPVTSATEESKTGQAAKEVESRCIIS